MCVCTPQLKEKSRQAWKDLVCAEVGWEAIFNLLAKDGTTEVISEPRLEGGM